MECTTIVKISGDSQSGTFTHNMATTQSGGGEVNFCMRVKPSGI